MCVSVVSPDAPADPPALVPLSSGPPGRVGSVTTLTRPGRPLSTEPGGDRAVEQPCDLDATHSVAELSVKGPQQ